jgi:hypothetical protein
VPEAKQRPVEWEPSLTVSQGNCFGKFTITIIFNQPLNEIQIPGSSGYVKCGGLVNDANIFLVNPSAANVDRRGGLVDS